jgi:hypothetical protein
LEGATFLELRQRIGRRSAHCFVRIVQLLDQGRNRQE